MKARLNTPMVRRIAAACGVVALMLAFVLTASARRFDAGEAAAAPDVADEVASSVVPLEAPFAPGDPATALRVVILATPCGNFNPLPTYTVRVGSVVAGTFTVAANCTCGPGLQTFTFTTPAALALLNEPTCTPISVSQNNVFGYVTWIRTEIVRPSATETACILDGGGTNCTTTNLCAGHQNRQNMTFTSTLADSDEDGISDCADTDNDNDGVLNATDNCPLIPNANQADADNDGSGDACDVVDSDHDGVLNASDNCPLVSNANQNDTDGNGQGDACDFAWDLDNDGIANANDNCPSVPNSNQANDDGDSAGDACDTEPVLAAVPWLGHESLSHQVYSGGSIPLQAVFTAPNTGDPVTITSATWDPGDGSGPAGITFSNSLALEKNHTYFGADGQPFTAIIRVVAGGKTYTDTFKVVIAPNSRETKVNMAIDKGLWRLHKQMQRTTSDGQRSAFWTGYSNYHMAATAGVVQAFEINNHRESGDPTKDPYAFDVARGLRYILSDQHGIMRQIGVPLQNGNNPDSNGNGYGLGINGSDHTPYIQGQVMDAIVASGTPAKVAITGQVTYVRNRKYVDIIQDLLDGYSFGMNDTVGGWHYTFNSGSNDTSASHWWAIGVLAAETWNLDAPEWVKNIQKTVGLQLMQAYPGDGHFGYTGNTNFVWDAGTNVTAAGLILMNADDLPQTHGRFVAASNYVNARYNSSMGNFYTMYQLTKAMRTALSTNNSTTPPTTTPITLLSGTRDWYAGYADHLIANQNAYGTGQFTATAGTTSSYIVGDMATSWGVIMLSTSLFELPPSAACTANPSQIGTAGGTVTFNAGGSFHPDSDVSIVSYTWNFDDGTPAGSGVGTTHTFTQPASFPTTRNVTVTVTDSQGLTATSACPVTIVNTNVAPNANAAGPYSMCQGQTLTLDGSTSADEDGTIASYKWSWGAVLDFNAPNATTASVDATAAFTALGVGTHNVGLQVTDNVGATNSEFTTVTVKAASDASCNQPPDAVDDTASTFSGTPVSITVLSNDTDPNAGQTLTVTGSSGGPANGSVSLAGGVFTYTPNAGFAGTDTFTYAISDGNSGTDSATVTITVTKRAASVTAGSGTKVYGSADPTLTPSSTGFLAGDNIVVAQTARDAGENVGSYATHAQATGAAIANYDVTYTDGSLAITKATPVATATGGTFTYDGQPHGGGCAVAGVNGEVLTGVTSYSSGGEPVAAGGHTITCAFAGDSNYDADSDTAAITIDKATAVATATGGTFTYDGQPHGGTCSVAGVGGDLLTGVTSYTSGGEPVPAGGHSITCAFAGDSNYNADSDTAVITIAKAAATVTAGSGSKVYGSADPTLTPTSSGFVAGDGIVVTQTARDVGENVGSYATHATATGAAIGNYTVTTTDGSLGITPAPLTVTANSVSRHYGTPNPTLTVSYSAFAFSDTPGVLGGTLSVTTLATQFSAVGSYGIVPSGLTSNNYAIAFVNGTLTVTNTAPSCAAAAPSVSSIWPPNHKLVPVTFNGVTDADGDTFTITVVSIYQDEPTNTQGDGNTPIDGYGVGTPTAEVRAERAGNPKTPGDGRVYHITITATDPAGGSCTQVVKVGVPHDQSGKIQPVDGGPLFKSTGGL